MIRNIAICLNSLFSVILISVFSIEVAEAQHFYRDHLGRPWYKIKRTGFIHLKRSNEDGTSVEFTKKRQELTIQENYLILAKDSEGTKIVLQLYDTNGDYVVDQQDSVMIAEGNKIKKMFHIIPDSGYSNVLNEEIDPDSLKKYLSEAIFGKDTDVLIYENGIEQPKKTIPTYSWFTNAQKIWDDNTPPQSLQKYLWKKKNANKRRTRNLRRKGD